MSIVLQVGSLAPSFSMPSTSGRTVSLSGQRGKKTVLYFYPKDDTPGCTKEACDFRDSLARIRSTGADVFGVSKDTTASHTKFQDKYSLPFELLTDADNKSARAYGAYGKKMLYGKPVEGTIRSTFVIDESSRITHMWSPVKVEGHVDQVLAALAASSSAAKKTTAKATAKIAVKTATPARKMAAKLAAPKAAIPSKKPAAKSAPAKKPAKAKTAKKKLARRA